MSTFTIPQLTALRAEIARLKALPEIASLSGGTDDVILDRINNHLIVPSVVAVPVRSIYTTLLFAGVWPQIVRGATASTPAGNAAFNITELIKPENEPFDATNADRLAWLDAQLTVLVTNSIITGPVKTSVLALKDAMVSWSTANLGFQITLTDVSQNV
jgi:hypothetical protein